MPRSRQLSMYLVVFGLALGACGGGDDDPDPQPTTTAPPTTESQEAEDEAALRQLAEDWYSHVTEAYRGSASADQVSDFLVDPYLGQFSESIADHEAAGNISEASPESAHEVLSIEIDGDSAVIEECIVDADVLSGPDGEVLNDDVVAQRLRTQAERTPDGWRLADRELVSELEGETQCAD